MRKIDLTKGNILAELILLALPIFGTSLIQVAYGFTDTFWIGQVSDQAVAAVGTSGYFLWLGASIALICKIGGNVKIAQSVGADDMKGAKSYITNSLSLNVVIALIYTAILLFFSGQLIQFFKIDSPVVNDMAESYLRVIAVPMVFYFFNPVISAILMAFGNAYKPFVFNTIGLILNMILDPLLILGIGPFPKLGVYGAGLATAISIVAVSLIFIIYLIRGVKKGELTQFHKLNWKVNFGAIKEICFVGLPVAIQSSMLAGLAMYMARIVAAWGAFAIAAQKVGTQIESISWATCEGFSVAVSSFVGQNFGAKQYHRLKKGFHYSMGLVSVIGLLATIVLLTLNKQIYHLFVNEPETIAIGINYLMILAVSQIFMCWEIAGSGAFNGISKSLWPAIIVVFFTALRIPGALIAMETSLGLNGIWWAISISSIFKGIFIYGGFIWCFNKWLRRNQSEEAVNV